MYGCIQILIKPDDQTKAILEFICSEANKLTNCAIYYARQLWFKARKIIGKYDLDAELKSNLHLYCFAFRRRPTMRSLGV